MKDLHWVLANKKFVKLQKKPNDFQVNINDIRSSKNMVILPSSGMITKFE